MDPKKGKKKMTMETAAWHELLSQPKYKMKNWEIDLPIKARDGTMLYADVCRPDAPGKFPALLSLSPYGKDMQHLPAPIGKVSDYTRGTGGHESGVTEYFVPRGYIHVHADYRGVSKSGGSYSHFGIKQQEDGYDIVEWIARQPWCDGNVGMLGMSYFATNQYLVSSCNRKAGATIQQRTYLVSWMGECKSPRGQVSGVPVFRSHVHQITRHF